MEKCRYLLKKYHILKGLYISFLILFTIVKHRYSDNPNKRITALTDYYGIFIGCSPAVVFKNNYYNARFNSG